MVDVLFLDTSAIVKRYVAEVGSAFVNRRLHESKLAYISSLTLVEVTAAFARRMERAIALSVQAQFDADIDSPLIVTNLDDDLVKQARLLVQRHRLRGCDALQLAAALRVRQAMSALDVPTPLHFLCADEELNSAADVEGLIVENPALISES